MNPPTPPAPPAPPTRPSPPTRRPGAPAPANGRSLTDHATRGLVWFWGQAIIGKGVSAVGQVVLGWLLLNEDYGLIGLAYTVMAFAALLQQGGLRQVLIQRQKRLDLWATPTFWMGLTLGGAASLAMLAAAPLAARLYGAPQLTGLVAVLALTLPLDALGIVPTARLQAQLRFRFLAGLTSANTVLRTLLTVLLAWAGLGAYSLAWPSVAVSAFSAAILWWPSPPQIGLTWRLRRWRYLIGPGGLLLAASFIWAAASQGGQIVLGLLQPAEVVGVYYFAFNLSLQWLQLITMNLEGVLFPTLSKLRDEPQRQVNAFLRATAVLAAVSAPLCMLQAAAADPLVRLLLPARWHPSIPILQILSVGMAFLTATMPTGALIQAQGRFRAYFWLSVACVSAFFGFMVVGSPWGAPGIAVAATAYYALTAFVSLTLAIRPAGRGLLDAVRVLGGPLATSAAAAAAGWGAAALIPNMPHVLWLRLAVTVTVTGLLYLAMLVYLMPATWVLVRERLGAVLGPLLNAAARKDASAGRPGGTGDTADIRGEQGRR